MIIIILRAINTLILIFLINSLCFAQNPICPPGVFIADPTARIWPDGRLYIYGSTDESTDYYCSWKHDVMSTSDLQNWQISEDIFASRGENDQVPYNNSLLFAPDCILIGDTYYLYYCQPDRKNAEGVALSKSPAGPFTGGVPIDLGTHNQIDPAVFIDNDGTAYYLWGQFSLKIAQLKPNMKELVSGSIRDGIVTEEEHYFHEGAFLTKRNGIYYLVYADISREDKPTCIGYATSRSPYGPYTYRGVIVDNDGCNPGNWNNHGSIAEYKGKWYVFYHRSTHGARTMRKTCVEEITFNEDGTIPEVEMTSQGAGEPLDAISEIDAARACLLHGDTRITAESPTNEILSKFTDESAAVYKYLDFGSGVQSIAVRIRPKSGGRLIISAGKPWYNRLAVYEVPAAEGDPEWQTLTFDVKNIEGVHALWIQGYGEGGELFDIDWFMFR